MKLHPFLLVLLLVCTLPIPGKCQLEKNVWYFGNNAGIDFSTGSPQALLNGQITAWEGGSVICDTLGTMLFYTDGVTVWNALHQPMPNGTGLYGGSGNGSTSQSSLIVRKPGSTNLFFIFTTDVQHSGPCNCFSYSVVDMNLQNGYGDVTSTKNVNLLAASTERIAAVKDAAGTGIWVIAHEWGNDAFHAYHITSAGINLTPVISNVGNYHMGAFPYNEKIGALRFSDDGAYLVCTMTYVNVFQLFDFNNNSGVVSNTRSVPFFRPYGAEFSPSNQFLYVTSGGGPNPVFKQFDISSGNQSTIISSVVNLTTGADVYGMIQRGPDNKLYIMRMNCTHLGQINAPDLPGTQCNYIDSAIYLGSLTGRLGLPNFMSGYHTYPNPKGIAETTDYNAVINIYPNPADNYFEVTVTDKHITIKSIEIYSARGECAYKAGDFSGNVRIDAAAFAAGIYCCKVILDSGTVINRKIICN